MEQITITSENTDTWPLLSRTAFTTITKAEQRRTLLGEDVVIMSIESAMVLQFRLRDQITIFGSKYMLNELPKVKKGGKRKFAYDLTWEGRQYDLLRPIYLDEGEDGISISPDFVLTGTLGFFLSVLINNCSRVLGSGVWVLGECPETEYQTVAFSNENCLAVLQRLCQLFNKEFEIVEAGGICTLNIKAEIGQTLTTVYEYGKGKGLWDLTRSTISEKNIVTRLYVFGSNQNLPIDYRGYSQRLKLPDNDLSYLEDSVARAAYGYCEGVAILDNIKPHRTGTVRSFADCTATQFIDDSMDFDIMAKDGNGNSLYWTGTAPVVHFNTGNLGGYELEVLAYDHATKKFTLKPYTDDRGQVYPDPSLTTFQLAVGDKYVILNIIMPGTYVTAAEAELLTAGQEEYIKVSQPPVQYAQTFDELYFKKLYPDTIVNVFGVGDYIPIKDTDINVDKAIRLKSFRRDVLYPYRYALELSDIFETPIVQKLIADNIQTQKVIINNNLTVNNGTTVTNGVIPIDNILQWDVVNKIYKPYPDYPG